MPRPVGAGLLTGLGRSFPFVASEPKSATGVAAVARSRWWPPCEDGGQSWWVAVVVGLFGFLWTTRTLMRNLSQATAHIWDAPTRRAHPRQMVVSTLVFAGAWLALFFASGLVSALDVVPRRHRCRLRAPDRAELRGVARDLAPAARPASVVDGPPAGFPPLRARARAHALVGRVDLPARFEHSSQLYGSLGVAAVILVWLLLLGHLTVVSALVNRVWLDYRVDRRRAGRRPRARPTMRRQPHSTSTAHPAPVDDPPVGQAYAVAQALVVADDEHRAPEGRHGGLELLDGVDVEVVRRLVEHEHVDLAALEERHQGAGALAHRQAPGGACDVLGRRARTSRAACARRRAGHSLAGLRVGGPSSRRTTSSTGASSSSSARRWSMTPTATRVPRDCRPEVSGQVAEQGAEQGRLAAAVVADDGDAVAAADDEADRAEPEAVPLDDRVGQRRDDVGRRVGPR